jgi:hypothetical protein
MSEQEENQLICEKLLGWKLERGGQGGFDWWEMPNGDEMTTSETPAFTTWVDAGLILDALSMRGERYALEYRHQTQHGEPEFFCFISEDNSVDALGHTGPLAIRSAALAYLNRSAT